MPSVRPDATAAVGHCPARAALAGNPSDGFGGAVVAVPVTTVGATVQVEVAERFEILPSPTSDDTFETLDDLVDRVDRFGYGDARQLVTATLRALHRHLGASIAPLRVEATTTVPRSVGLAGSSALVIATIRAVATAHPGAAWAQRLEAAPDLVAAIALDVETSELGIRAGLQDRLVQAYEQPLMMDFSAVREIAPGLTGGRVEVLPTPPGIMFVATRPAAAEPSGVTHGSLRTDFDDDRGRTRSILRELAERAHDAARAVERGDATSLGEAMDATLDLRRSLLVLDPRHLEMAEVARSRGCHANWTGSGGSITVLAPNDSVATTACCDLRDLGCDILDP